MKNLTLILLFCVSIPCFSQLDSKGLFSLGVRNTYGFFETTEGVSTGVGGNFRIQLSDRINTEWYADYIFNSFEYFSRKDYHIGWSVLYYFLPEPGMFQPYIEGGHCFDLSKMSVYEGHAVSTDTEMGTRFSSAVQLGLGTHLNITDRFDITLKTQYMLHLGKELHAHTHQHGDQTHVEIEEGHGAGLEGHLLGTISLNYKIGNLW